ncbi:MAG TPA: acyclic terpene utilization AtuA family protein [Burkholderiaceae bacterium]|nr:acyclic terpene utilization AtuA family protein [Burkholderiaceae bacterium]
METFKIGCAAGFSGDRVDGVGPVVKSLIDSGGHTLIFETLAERTLALAQLTRNRDPDAGYEPLLEDMLRPCLADCLHHNISIVSNFGQANPPSAARHIARLAREMGLRAPRIAVLAGDRLEGPDVMEHLSRELPGEIDSNRIVCINAYQGAEEIAQALQAGADVVVAGRVSDPSLVVGPARAHFGWGANDWQSLAIATMAGHLLECGTQVTGGYFAVPGLKDIPGMHDLGFPLAEITKDGQITISKPAGTGGLVNARTVKEQLLYEVHNPAAYLTPDVTADISQVEVQDLGGDRVQVRGIRGWPRPEQLKVNAFMRGGWLAEAEISYAGVQAEARARLAADILRKRLGPELRMRVDLIGSISVFADDAGSMLDAHPPSASRDIRLRVAAVHDDRHIAEKLLKEMNALYTCGPAGGGGVRTSLKPRLNSVSALIPRELAPASWSFLA